MECRDTCYRETIFHAPAEFSAYIQKDSQIHFMTKIHIAHNSAVFGMLT